MENVNYFEPVIFNKRALRQLFDTDCANMSMEQKFMIRSMKSDKERNKTLLNFLKDSICVKRFNTCIFKSLHSLIYFQQNENNGIPVLQVKSKSDIREIFDGDSEFSKFFLHYFYESDDNYKLKLNFNDERLIINENDRQEINLTKQIMKHEVYPKDNAIEKEVDYIIKEFIGEIISDGCEKQLDILLDCLAKLCKGEKLDIFLYLYSSNSHQGSGKSTFIDIIEKLIGSYNVIALSDSIVKNRFNAQMYGYRVVKLDDLTPSNETMNKFKEWTTNSRISYESKGKDIFEDVCMSSFIASSNQLPPKEQRGGRRSFIISPSTKWIGKHEKWNELYAMIADKRVMSVLFHRLKERKTPNKLQPKLETLPCFGDGLRQMLPSLYRYLINEYILSECKDEQRIRCSEFHANYGNYMRNKNLKEQSAQDIAQMLKDVDINQTKNSVWFYQFSVKNLKELFIKRKFLTNDIIEEYEHDNGKVNIEITPQDEILKENRELKKRIIELEKKINKESNLEEMYESLNADFDNVVDEMEKLRNISESMEKRLDEFTEFIESNGKEVKFSIDAFTNKNAKIKIVDKKEKKEKKKFFTLSDSDDDIDYQEIESEIVRPYKKSECELYYEGEI
jgi:hypothetical protein